MDRTVQALTLVRECESRIRQLIEKALADRAYDALPELASIAGALSAISGQPTTPPGPRDLPEAMDEAPNRPASKALVQQLTAKREAAYPRFMREVDRLVKVGWSKKDKAEYEHRASSLAVQAVFERLVATTKKRAIFKPDDLVPTKLTDGSEVPSYQVYLVLAWLRDHEVVERQGNDGYRVTGTKQLAISDFMKIWNKTQERASA